MKKRFFSLFLALCMIFSMTAFAEDGDTGYSSEISLEGQGTEEWTITVPALITFDSYNDVAVSGYWAGNKKLTVTIPETVTLTNERGSTYDIEIAFRDGMDYVPSFDVRGNDMSAISGAGCMIRLLNVDTVKNNLLFGTWTGSFNYTVTLEEIPTT